ADAVAPAAAGEQPSRLPMRGGQAAGGEQRVGKVEGPAHGQPLDHLAAAVAAEQPQLADAPRDPARDHLEAREREAGVALLHERRELMVGLETLPRAPVAGAVVGDALGMDLLLEREQPVA